MGFGFKVGDFQVILEKSCVATRQYYLEVGERKFKLSHKSPNLVHRPQKCSVLQRVLGAVANAFCWQSHLYFWQPIGELVHGPRAHPGTW